MRNAEWIRMLNDWADEADSGEDVSLDGDTLRELAGLIPVYGPCEPTTITLSGASISAQDIRTIANEILGAPKT